MSEYKVTEVKNGGFVVRLNDEIMAFTNANDLLDFFRSEFCGIPKDEWINHDGTGRPVEANVPVIVRFKNGEERSYNAGYWAASWTDSTENPIVAYRTAR